MLSDHRHSGGWSRWLLDPSRAPAEGIESHVVDAASIATSRRRRRAKTDGIDGEALVRALLAYKRGEPRVCAMVRAPTPAEEDRRRISRERKTLTNERISHVNRVKGLLFAQGVSGYEPLRRDRRKRLEELMTGDGRPATGAFEGANRPRTRSAGTVAGADQGCRGRTRCHACCRAAYLTSTDNAAQPERHRAGVCRCLVVGGAVTSLRQPTTGCRLCGPRADTLAERVGRLQPRGIESRQSKAANGADPDGLALAAPSTAIGTHLVVIALARKLLVALWKYVNAGVVIEGAVMKTA